MKTPYDPTHPAYKFQCKITEQIHDKVLMERRDGSKVIIYRRKDGHWLRAKNPSEKELATMTLDVPELRPGVEPTVAVRVRSRDKAVRRRTRLR